jgi:hypothetical protein
MSNAINRTALLAVIVLGSTAFLGAAQASPSYKHSTTSTENNANVRVAAGEKKEVEGTKADVREDKAEAAKKADAMEDKMGAKVKHKHKMKHAM